MSGGFTFPDNQEWIKAGWVYRTVLDCICCALETSNITTDLYLQLSDGSGTERTIEHVFAENWERSKLILLCESIEEGYKIAVREGSQDWSNPDAFQSFIEAFNELVELSKNVTAKYS